MALDFPASPSNGQTFTSGGVSWSFDGDKWKVNAGTSVEPVFVSSTAPTGVAGQIYWDSDESTAYIYYDDGNTAQWVPLVSTAPVSFDTSAIVSGTLPVARGGTGTTSFDAGKIAEGNTEAEVVDTGSDGHFKVTTEGTERIRVGPDGQIGLAGANYGTSGQVLESGGSSAAVSWATPVKLDAAQTFTAKQTFNAGISIDGPYEQTAQAVSALDIDCSTGNYFTKAISADSTFTFSNVPSTGVYSFTIEIEVTGDRNIQWPGAVKFNGDSAPTLTADRTHLFMFVTDDGGTRFRAAALVDYVD